MDSQKIENILNLSLDSSMEEREKSNVLNVGYDEEEKTWEIIVKYQGEIMSLSNEKVQIEILINGYAIVTLPESMLDIFVKSPIIEYIEKPKNLIYGIYEAKRVSGIIPATLGENGLSGKGVLVAVIDSGIDYTLPDFQNAQGSRIKYLWDQSLPINEEQGFYPPMGFNDGVEFTKEQIDLALVAPTTEERDKILPSKDLSGHGTAVASIAAGSSEDIFYRGVASNSELVVVKLGNPKVNGFPRTTELMRALTYCLRKADLLGMPIAINLSFGNTYGAHDGTSLLERFIDNSAEVGRTSIVVGSGNEGVSGGHASGKVDTIAVVELLIGELETGLSVQLWKNYGDQIEVTLISSAGKSYPVLGGNIGREVIALEEMKVLIYVGEPTPYSMNQEIFFDFIPENNYLPSGLWKFQLKAVRIRTGNYQFYLPSGSVRSERTRFVSPTSELTITIPATAAKVISVGACDKIFDSYADFSGRGKKVDMQSDSISLLVKPDLVAPGVDILAARSGGGYGLVTGTSFAAPIVTGVAALLMEDGIVRENDRYCYGEKLKAKLIRGAQPIGGIETIPNEKIGWGKVNLFIIDESIRII